MARIALAWEIGGGLGHVSRLLVVAKRFRELGHECIFVFSDIEIAGALVQAEGFEVLPAPKASYWLQTNATGRLGSHGDILAHLGYSVEFRLGPILTAWKSILRQINPDIVILDYAPTARLAVGVKLPTVVIGDGFTIPPAVDGRFPRFRNVPPIIDEAAMLKVIANVQSDTNEWCPKFLPELFTGDKVFVATLPQLDCFSEQRDITASGPLVLPPPLANGIPKQKFFAYLAAGNKGLPQLIEALHHSDLNGGVFLLNLKSNTSNPLQKNGLIIFKDAQDMSEMANDAAVIIHHGGIGTCVTALGLGRPQIILPLHLEQRMNAESLKRTGAAVILSGWQKLSPDQIIQAIKAAIEDAPLRNRARQVAQGIAVNRHASLDYIICECQKLL